MATHLSNAEAYAGQYKVPSLAGIKGRLRVDGPNGTMTLVVDNGTVTAGPEKGGGADCVLTAFEAGDLAKIICGDMNIVTAILRGRLRVDGDPLLALRMAGSMPEIGKKSTQGSAATGGGR